MKKTITLFTALCLLITAATAQVVNIPDANFKAYLVGNTAINTNNDGEIQVSEAEAFNDWMVCNSLGITDMTGIEAFTALTQLLCYNNQLTSLDVSQNTALAGLLCYGNQLTSLDVSQNTALTDLYCHENQLTSLNVANGNNSNFFEFYAQGNSDLTCIQVDDANYSTNNWTGSSFIFDAGVNFSESCAPPCVVNIPDANFKSYLVGNTAINTNNDGEIQCSEAEAFSGNISCVGLSISNLGGIEAFVNLTVLDCGNNQLTTLDVSQNTSLSHLGCGQNQISSLDVSQNTALTSLNLHTNNVSSLDLSLNTALAELYCDNNQLTGLDVSQNTALVTLYCHQNQLTGLDVSQNTALTSLNLRANNVSSLDLSLNTALAELYCNNNQLTELDVSQNTALETLFCYENQLTGLDVSFNTELINFACNDNQLTSLNVANGNNTNFNLLHANNNSPLTCVEVDDAAYSTANWPGGEFWFDAGVTFSEDCNPTPADNECDGANDINSLFGGAVNTPMTSSLYNHTGYTSEGTDPTAGFDCHYQGNPLQNTIWFSFDGDGNTYRIRTVDCSATNPHSDPQAALYSGDCNALTPVLCNDDEDVNNNLFNVQLDVETVQGTTYHMLVDGYNGAEGEFCLEVTRIDPSNIFEAEYQTVNVYPNPTEGVVRWNGITAQTAEVMDNTGRMVMNIAQPNGTLDISNLKEGIYIMMLHTEEGVYTSRVVKQ